MRRAALASAASTLPLSAIASSVSESSSASFPEAGPLVMIELPGPSLDPVSRDLIRRHRVRGVVLFQRNIVSTRQVRELNAELRELMGPGALIAIDQEGGGVVRTLDLPFPPSAMSLGAAGDTDLAEQVGAATGRALASLGFNWNFAPVLDVNNNPMNPVIGDRSFGSDPFLVSSLGLAWARGCESAGVATCAKHFPGHGDTNVDSHLGLPVVEKSRNELLELEFRPFEHAAEAGIPSFMTSHILYPSLDREHPATLSRNILTGVLRDRWGYDGVIITDSLKMHAISRRYGRNEATLLSIQAGADMVTALGSPREVEQALVAISRALSSGLLSDEDRARREARLDGLARRFPSALHPYTLTERTLDGMLMTEAWGRGLTLYRNPTPPAPGSPVTLVVAGQAGAGGASSRGLSGPALAELMARRYDLETVFYDRRRPMRAAASVRSATRDERTVIVATTGRVRPNEELKQLIRVARPDLHLALWNPYTVLDVNAPALITYGFRPEALERTVAWMVGDQPATGKLPIELQA